MMAILYVLAFLFLSTSFSQAATHVTYWTGNGQNNTWSNSDNWDNGVPDTGSIVYINDTSCNGCDVEFDVAELSVSELHLDAFKSTGPTLVLGAGTSLIVTSHFNLGTVVAAPETSYHYIEVRFEGGWLSWGKDCQVWLIYSGYENFYANSGYNGTVVNNGTVTVKTNLGVSAGTEYQIGYYSSSGPLWFYNWGDWVVNDPNGVVLYFYYVDTFNHYSGSFNTTNYVTTSTSGDSTPTLEFYNTDVVFQPGSETTTWFNGPVWYYSSSSINTDGYSSTLPTKVWVNTTNFDLYNAKFYAVNVVFNDNGSWIKDSNFTYYSIINTTSSANVWLGGTIRFTGYTFFSALDGNLWVSSDASSTLYLDSSIYQIGASTFVNNGTLVSEDGYLYVDAAARVVNLGLIDVQSYLYLYGSSFQQTTDTNVGDFVNRGTVQSTTGGYLYYYSDSGTFYQCDHGVIKYTFSSTSGQSSGTHRFKQAALDGYFGVAFDSKYDASTSSLTLAYFDYTAYASEPKKGVFTGDLTEFTKGPNTIPTPQLICIDPTIGYVYLYPLLKGTCSSHYSYYTNTINPGPVGGVCKSQNSDIMSLAVRCPVSANCGIDTGAPVGDSGNNASHLPISLALLVSLIGYLFFQY